MDNALYFLIGASGAGKTAVSKRLEGERDFAVQVFYFDTIGVPSIDEMWKQFGSGEEWQRVKTVEWVATLKDKWLSHGDTLLDSQTRPAFIREACKKHGIENYSIILLDCDTGTRKERLEGREQGELETDDMDNWAAYLRDACANDAQCTTIDTSSFSLDEVVGKVKATVEGLSNK